MSREERRLENKIRMFEDLLLRSKRYDEALIAELQRMRMDLQKKKWKEQRA